MEYRISITQQANSEIVDIEVYNFITGEVIATGTAMFTKQAIIRCITAMLDEHL